MNRDLLRRTAMSAFVAATLHQTSASFAQGAPPAPPSTAAGQPPSSSGLQDPMQPPTPPPPGAPGQPPAPPAPPPVYPAPPPAPPQPAAYPPGYAPGSYGQSGWAPPAPPPPEPQPKHPKGVTDELVPFDQRGGIYLATSVFAAGDQDLGERSGLAGGSVVLEGNFHLTKHFFLDVTVPFGISVGATVGNPTLEARGIVPLGKGGASFLIIEGGLGFPVLNDDTQNFENPQLAAVVANGLWDMHLFTPWSLPIIGRFGTENLFGRLALLRTSSDFIFEVPYGTNDEPEVQLQQAVELQLGQTIGGGLRVQTVILPTWEDTDNDQGYDDDLFQLALEPFFSYEGDVMAGRLGLMLPIDEKVGPPFEGGWGFRAGLGARFD